ncbi:hypothetical protein GF395_04290 [Candidatus Uhrbacteria bacterium]|nr:hypothetical protein [Candidatus Uhrbacteria bacterium]
MTVQLGQLAEVTAIHVDLPLERGEAAARGLPGSVCRLLVQMHDDAGDAASKVRPLLARLVVSWRCRDEVHLVVPIARFSDVRKQPSGLGVKMMHSGDETGYILSSESELQQVWQHVGCEEFASLYAANEAVAQRWLDAINAYSGAQRSHNEWILNAAHGAHGAVFYAPSHVSIEVVGARDFIVERCVHSIGLLAVGDDDD